MVPRVWFKHTRNWFESNTLHVSKEEETPAEVWTQLERKVKIEIVAEIITTLVVTFVFTTWVFRFFGL